MNIYFYNKKIEDTRFEQDISKLSKKIEKVGKAFGGYRIKLPLTHGLINSLDKEMGKIIPFEPTPIVKIEGEADGHWLKARSEMLILRGDRVFIRKHKSEICDKDRKIYGSELKYTVPGGQWSEKDGKYERFKTAIREVRQEAKKRVKHVVYANNYIIWSSRERKNHPCKSSEGKAREKYRWYGYYTQVYVGEYNGNYNWLISPFDRDRKFDKGDFYKVDEVIDDLRPEHREAIKMYMDYRNNRR